MKKTLISLLLCLVMLFGVLPIMVTAAGWSGITVLGFNYGDDGMLSLWLLLCIGAAGVFAATLLTKKHAAR